MKAIFLLISLLVIHAWAGVPSNFDFSARVEIIEPTHQHYHWMSRNQLEKWAQSIKAKNGKFHFPSQISKTSQFANTFKIFARRKGIFTWIDPVLSKQSPENYGGQQAALLVLGVKPNARAIRVVSPFDDGRHDFSELIIKAGLDPKKVDLIEHINPRIHEWILLSPQAIDYYTVDPKVTHPILKEFLEPYLKNSEHKPHYKNIHYAYNGIWRPSWYYRSTSHEPFKFNEKLYQYIIDRFENILLTTPEGPYFDEKVFKKTFKYELSTPFYNYLKKPLPKELTGPQAGKSCIAVI